MNDDNRFDPNHDEPHQPARVDIRGKSSRGAATHSDRSDIRVFEDGVSHQPAGDYGHGSRVAEQEESRRLITVAKANGLYFPSQTWNDFGDQRVKPSGESLIFVNEAMGLVFKVRDPFAKSPIKRIAPQDIILEHLVHNLLFPATRYNFVGIGECRGEVRIILSQKYVSGWTRPQQGAIDSHLSTIGLIKEDNYYYGNEYLAVTDVASGSDNVLSDEDGSLCFIDPLIRFRKPAAYILDNYPLSPVRRVGIPIPKDGIVERIKRFFATTRGER